MQEELAKKDRLASLVTLAAGAAHELSTPLATIAVIANELERYALRTVRDPALADDSRLIREEVQRCSEILRRMSVHGAEPAGEAAADVPVDELLAAVRANFSGSAPGTLEFAGDAAEAMLHIPRHAVAQALIALVKNAFEASPVRGPVRLSVSRSVTAIRFAVSDDGPGMSQETLRHIGEPFFTTKEPGKGMGLGIFLVRTLADRLGGALTFDSVPGRGTTAVFELPVVFQSEEVKA